ncbi:TPA: capsid cement protein, partial [Pasteurella multocida]
MAKNYIQDGDTLRFTAKKAVKSGDVVVVGEMVGVAITDVENKAQGVLRVTGVFTVKAKQADNIEKGAVLYWDESAGEATTTKGSHKAGTFYKIYDDLTTPNHKFIGLPDGEYVAEIRAKNEQGQISDAVTKSFNISFAVSELTTVSKVFGILLQWKNPVFANPNSAIEIWTSTDNQFENARKLVSLSYPTSEYLFSGLGVNEKHYFWVRMIDTANGNAGEFTKSVVGTSEKSGKKLVEYIQGQVTKSTLAKDLAQEITQIQATASEAT